ncbi:MAG TPA: L-seryl-tRNA(Sec) selenium transferase [Vicinamibacterales bacterium]
MHPARLIPSIDRLRQHEEVPRLEAEFGAAAVLEALRDEATRLRTALLDADTPPSTPVASPDAATAAIVSGAAARLRSAFRSRLQPVINATGVVIHTNLGRAPLASSALERMRELAGYASLELDLESGRRGRRDVHAEALLCSLTGAEAAVVVNNNAAAALLMLTAIANGREVIVSRGELVEIGGGFRVPDIMRQSGAVLREVGTTNRTRIADYAAAIGDRTAALLRVHPSNFVISGFTERPPLAALAALAKAHGVPLLEDLGSGLIDGAWLPALREPDAVSSLRAGVDLVTFSGDKLLGGPQAGILVGRRDLVQQVRTHPLMRALRVDKLTYAALEATLLEYRRGRAGNVPVVRMLSMTAEAVEARARAVAASLRESGWHVEIVDGWSAVGGGSAPGERLPTRLVRFAWPGWSADSLLAGMRALDPPIIARIEDDAVVLDLRTVAPEQDAALIAALTGLAHGSV